MLGEVWQIMKEIGYKFYGVVDLQEEYPHRSRTTAWGSWMSPSAPYIYNPKECVILAYKKNHIKKIKGEPQWVGELGEKEDKNGVMKPKTIYTEEQKREFIDLVFGQWNYFADTRSLTKATFSMDIPTKAIKILTYKNDVVLDPFAGSGTSMVAAETLNRRWVGIELSPNYCKVANERVGFFVQQKRQQVLDFAKKQSEDL
jgi:site-specific DNA-methyltransferase (adenine-specific)